MSSLTPFTVDVTADDNPNLSVLPPGYTCVPINGGVELHPVHGHAVQPQRLGWQLHPHHHLAGSIRTRSTRTPRSTSQGWDGFGSCTLTAPDSQTSRCRTATARLACVDPAIGGKDDNFSDFIVAQTTAVPEPATYGVARNGPGGAGCTPPPASAGELGALRQLLAVGVHRADVRALEDVLAPVLALDFIEQAEGQGVLLSRLGVPAQLKHFGPLIVRLGRNQLRSQGLGPGDRSIDFLPCRGAVA